jgi:anthranilate/para-aminobenzoate synthase component I
MTARTPSIPGDPLVAFLAEAQETSGPAFYFERGPSLAGDRRWAIFGTAGEDACAIRDPGDAGKLAEHAAALSPGSGQRWFGYLGFDACGLLEPLLRASSPRGSPFPPGLFYRFPQVRTGHPRGRVPAWRKGEARLTLGPVRDQATPAGFAASVRRLKRAIAEGEAFQVVLAHRRERSRSGPLLRVLSALRERERYAYLFYFRFGAGDRGEIVGASPESVLEVRGGMATIDPIAGTIPRPAPRRGPGARLPLRSDPKELAEHRMLVDLARNDLGKVCQVGSVRVLRKEVRVRYARLEHLVSRVGGRLGPGQSAVSALASAFPAGTVSGAPKIRAIQLLRREERTWRGPYAGAVGVLGPDREADFGLAIRTAFAFGHRLFTAAGAGIVHASRPRQEWEETLHKLSALEGALAEAAGAPWPPSEEVA